MIEHFGLNRYKPFKTTRSLRCWSATRPALLLLTYEWDCHEYILHDTANFHSYSLLAQSLPKLFLGITKEGEDVLEEIDPKKT